MLGRLRIISRAQGALARQGLSAQVPRRTFSKDFADKISDPRSTKIPRGSHEFGESKTGNGADSNFAGFVYRNFFARNPVYVLVVIATGMIGTVIFEEQTDAAWNMINPGKDFDSIIPTQFPNLPPGCGDDDDDEDDEDDE